MFDQFSVAFAGLATRTTPSVSAAARATISFRLLNFRISVPPSSDVLRPDGGGLRDLPGGRRYDESVSSLTPQQEPEMRGYELDPPPPEADHAYRDYEPIHPRGRLGELARKLWAPIAALGLLI